MQGMKKTMVHAIFFDKNFFPTVEAAKTWAQANNFKNDEHQEDDWMWVFEQVKQAEFVLGAYGEGQDFRVVQVAEGVHATVGETEVKMAKSNFKHSKDSFDAEHLPSLVAEAYEQTEQEYMVFFVVNFNYFTISSHNHKSINIDKIYFTIALLT